jgi:pilus assembly protein CpaE
MRNPRIVVLDEDGAFGRQVERAVVDLRPRPEASWCDSFDAVDELIAATGPFDILLAGPLAALDGGLEQVRRLRGRLPDMQLILAFDEWPRRRLRETVRAGATDVLRLPVSDEALVDTIAQTLENVPTPPPPRPEGPEVRNEGTGGTVTAVVSATGGCGKTFFATNLAYHLQSQGRRTCVLDLDLQFGEVSAALRLKPTYTIADLVALDADDDELGALLEKHLVVDETGISVLAAPETPAEADRIDPIDVARIIEAARCRFDDVILDAPTALRDPVLVAIEQADQIFAIATLDLPSVRNLGVMLTTFRQLQVPADRVNLLLNKVERDVGIDVATVEKYFPQGFSMVIPYGREVNRCLNMGCTVLASAPRCDVGKALAAGLARTTVGRGRARPASTGGRPGPAGTEACADPRRPASPAGPRTRAGPPRRP